MIAGVVVTFSGGLGLRDRTLSQIAARPEFELGAYPSAARRVPLTIESGSRSGLETLTQWLRSQAGVVFVDVVLVYLEDDRSKEDNASASIRNFDSHRCEVPL